MSYWDFDAFDDDMGYGLDMCDLRSTPLHDAAQAKDITLVEGYLKNGANVNARDGQDRNVIQVAVQTADNEDVIRILLAHGADATSYSGIHGNALVHAVQYPKNLQILLDHAASHNEDCHGFADSALYGASEIGQIQTVRILLARGTNPNARGSMYGNALQAAAHYGNIEVVQALLDAGAQVNAQGGYHGNALQAAARYGRVQLVQVLLKAGADVNARGGVYGNALTAATRRNHPEVVNILQRAGAEEGVMSDSQRFSQPEMFFPTD